MTDLFARFQNEKYGCPDLGEHFGDASIEGVPGLLYADGQLYIEKVATGGYQLILNNDCYASHDLAMLERKLFDWADSEGYFDDEDR